MVDDQRWKQAYEEAYEKQKEFWEWEREQGLDKPAERPMRYTITIDCTHSTFENIKDMLKGFAIGKKWYRQEEIPARAGGGKSCGEDGSTPFPTTPDTT